MKTLVFVRVYICSSLDLRSCPSIFQRFFKRLFFKKKLASLGFSSRVFLYAFLFWNFFVLTGIYFFITFDLIPGRYGA